MDYLAAIRQQLAQTDVDKDIFAPVPQVQPIQTAPDADLQPVTDTQGRLVVPGDYSLSMADQSADALARAEADPNGTIAPITAGQALGLGRGIGGSPNNQRPYAVGEKTVHTLWGPVKVPIDANGNEVGLFSSAPAPAFSKQDYAAAPQPRPETSTSKGPPLYDESGNITPEGKKQLESIGPHVKVGTSPKDLHFADKSAENDDGKKKDGATGGGGGAGGGASASLGVAGGMPIGAPDWDEPYAMGVQAVQAQGAAQAREQDALAQGAKNRAALLDQQQAQMERVAKERDDILAQHEAEVDRLAKEAASGTVDPDRWWKTRNTGQRITMIIAAALGGFANGFRGIGGPIPALQMIQHSIDNDIDAQKEDILNKHRGVEHAQGLLADLYRRFGRMDQAESVARQVALEHVEQETNQLVAGAKSDEAKANAQVMLANLDERRMEHQDKDWELATKLAAEMQMRRARGGGGGAGAGADEKAVEKLEQQLEHDRVYDRLDIADKLQADLDEGGSGITGVSGAITSYTPNFLKWLVPDKWQEHAADFESASTEASRTGGGRMAKVLIDQMKKNFGSGNKAGMQRGAQNFRDAVVANVVNRLRDAPPAVQAEFLERHPDLVERLQRGGGGGGGGGANTGDDKVKSFGEK